MNDSSKTDDIPFSNATNNLGGAKIVGHSLSIFEIYAHKAEKLHPIFHALIVFGIVFVLVVAVGSRDPRNVAIMAATILAAYLLAFIVMSRGDGKVKADLSIDANELTRFLGIPSQGGLVGIFVTTTEAVHSPERGLPYTVRSVALADVQAVVEIVSMLAHLDLLRDSSAFEPGNLFIHESSVDNFRGNTLFLVGGPLPNVFVRNIVHDSPFIDLEDAGDEITISCSGISDTYSIRPPREHRTIRQTESYSTYGCIMRLRQGKRTTFAIWGLDERGTRGAGRWLAANWEFALKEFGEGEFTAIVRFPPGGTHAPDDVQRHPDMAIPVLIPLTSSLSTTKEGVNRSSEFAAAYRQG